jgi:hypothetical protein
VRYLVLKRILRESLIVSGITLVFLVICATVGISTSTPPTSPTAEAAYEREHDFEDEHFDRFTAMKREDVKTSPLMKAWSNPTWKVSPQCLPLRFLIFPNLSAFVFVESPVK